MTKHEFQLPDGSLLTSVVMSEEEFNEMCDFLKNLLTEAPPVNAVDGQRAGPEAAEAIREHKNLPMIARGTLTEPIFNKYGIPTNRASFIVRAKERTFSSRRSGARTHGEKESSEKARGDQG